MPYRITQKEGALTVIQEFTGDGSAVPKTFQTYGEAHYFAENMALKGYIIEKVDGESDNDTRVPL